MTAPAHLREALLDLADCGQSGAFARDMGTALDDMIEELVSRGYASGPHAHLDGPYWCITQRGLAAHARASGRRAA